MNKAFLHCMKRSAFIFAILPLTLWSADSLAQQGAVSGPVAPLVLRVAAAEGDKSASIKNDSAEKSPAPGKQPDPTKILLPSGQTLSDAMNNLDARMRREDTFSLLKEVSRQITEYGPFPTLLDAQKILLATARVSIKLDDASAARVALPRIRELRALAPDDPQLVKLEALALHQAGDFAQAKAGYSKWLNDAGPQDAERQEVTDNLARAGRGEAPVLELAKGSIHDCPDCPEMVILPAGSFQMGGNKESREQPVHTVVFTNSFAIGKTAVTQGQWKAVMGNNPSHFSHCGDDCPVETVSWDDAQAYVKKLSQMTGKTYQLPSEAEWEYACRAGQRNEYCGGDDADIVLWYEDNSGKKTRPVAGRQPNAWGLYDMSGNVWQWTEDCWNDGYRGAPADGSAWTVGKCEVGRVLRGGSWGSSSQSSRSALRNRRVPTIRSYFFGFRVVRML